MLVCCGNGAGTSMMIKLNVEKVIKKIGLYVQSIYHCAISEGKSLASQYDVVLCSKNFVPMFQEAEKKGYPPNPASPTQPAIRADPNTCISPDINGNNIAALIPPRLSA